ncbi:citrate lyase beta subunit [Guyanagaster necrorhizus]|uniref:Citrate lyase beta subunit n=1 Tax=Guyanagaster necrorhizus TaxID=856835 RepID=A0A9P7VNB1_9AGAR|nr:citrate lyase beta subunit [Guyanagaster necrorhizus MCA 3950]KAG7443009.1 citrate lyase beta subunit [Guyanagaster necrorhizus MCA 3950]
MFSIQTLRNVSIAGWASARYLSTDTASTASLKRSYLYVPSSSSRMLEKSLAVNSDMIIYDLEDSVSPKDKVTARNRLQGFLKNEMLLTPSRIAVRINDRTTPFFVEDLAAIVRLPTVRSIVLPKVHSVEYLTHVASIISETRLTPSQSLPLCLVASIESSEAVMNASAIAAWKPPIESAQGCVLGALLFAAEDYCADTSIIRTRSRQELLYTRSHIVNAARANKLEAIDMVCVNYKDEKYLKEECQEGRRMGFTGKQAIHPSQVDTIQATFVPTTFEIVRAAKIVHNMQIAHESQKGAIGLEGEMVDAPMIKQAEKIIQIAKAAGLDIPDVV